MGEVKSTRRSEAAKRVWAEVREHERRRASGEFDAPRDRHAYRDGKITVVVHLTPEEHEALQRIKLRWRKEGRYRREDGRPIALADVVKKALSDLIRVRDFPQREDAR